MRWDDVKRRLKLSPVARKRLGAAAIVLVVAYIAFGCTIWWAMNQSPETFGRVMKRLPGPVPFLLFPFETPGFTPAPEACRLATQRRTSLLLKVDKTDRVQLSVLNKQQPVVLVFGSYT